jgi:hypothetical protein
MCFLLMLTEMVTRTFLKCFWVWGVLKQGSLGPLHTDILKFQPTKISLFRLRKSIKPFILTVSIHLRVLISWKLNQH